MENNNNKMKDIQRQHLGSQNRKPRQTSVARNIKFPPKVKMLMMKNRPATASVSSIDSRPNLDHLINIASKSGTKREYIRSFLSLLRNTPGISWDSSGNLFEPFRNFNIINILNTLSDVGDKKGFEKEDVPFIKMILQGASLDSSFIRNNKAKKQLMGGSKLEPFPPFLAQAQKTPWEKYRL